MKVRAISVTCAATALLLTACSSNAGQPVGATSTAGDPSATTVAIHTFMFMPNPLHVAVGTTVTWTNQDQIDHTVTSGTPNHPTDVFDGTLPQQGATYNTTFSKPGTYPYFCRIHNVMRGEIVVTA